MRELTETEKALKAALRRVASAKRRIVEMVTA